MSARTVTACVLIIGNEILSGRTQDTNLNHITLTLGAWGIQVREARVIPDVPGVIIDTVNEVRERFDYVFTTGGIGPTHDDITADCIADAFLQEILLHPQDYDVVATLNLNGDYMSDALAAQVGGIGIAPGANLSDTVAMFEATHGTAPKIAGKDLANPSSIILSAEMMLRHLGWTEAADLVLQGVAKAILANHGKEQLVAQALMEQLILQ